MKVDVIFQMFQLYFIIEKLRPDVLTLFTTLYDHLVSRNLFSKSAMRQFGASGPERLDIDVFVGLNDRCTQVAQSWESLNKSDCFILDLGNEIYVWCGPNSNPWERMSANEMGRSIRDDERAGKVKSFFKNLKSCFVVKNKFKNGNCATILATETVKNAGSFESFRV